MAGFGLKPLDMKQDDLVTCLIPSTDSTITGIGDGVILAGSSDALTDSYHVPTVQRAAAGAGNPLWGVIVNCDQVSVENTSFSLERRHRPASVGMYVQVHRAKHGNRYLIEPTAAVAKTAVGSVANLVAITDADTTSGVSKMRLDQSTLQASGNPTYQLRVVSVDPKDLRLAGKTIGTDIIPIAVEINNIQVSEGDDGI